MRPSEWDDDLMNLAFEEAGIGCNSEPRILTHENVLTYTLCRRVPVKEERASGWRKRAVDDETEAGINPATVQDHATVYNDISKLATMSRFCLDKGADVMLCWSLTITHVRVMISVRSSTGPLEDVSDACIVRRLCALTLKSSLLQIITCFYLLN
jgi:hypothetical protein